MTKQVMQQALEALIWECGSEPALYAPKTAEAIEALREALAQQGEQQPVGSVDYGCEPHRINWEINPFSLPDGTPLYAGAAPAAQPDWSLLEATQESLREHMAMVKELQDKLAQQGEPVAEVYIAGTFKTNIGTVEENK